MTKTITIDANKMFAPLVEAIRLAGIEAGLSEEVAANLFRRATEIAAEQKQ